MDRSPNDFHSKALIALIPFVLAVAGWAYSIDNRLRDVSARQEERGPRLSALEEDVDRIKTELDKPSSRLEDRFEQRLTRMEERLNHLHLFILQFNSVVRPYQRRGDLEPSRPPPFRQDYQERDIN